MDSGSSCVHAPARVTLRIAALLAGLLLLPVTAHAESQEAQTHVVYSGQRLGSIAKRYGVSVEALCTANDLRPTAPLKPGQRLVIPARGDRDGSRARIAAGHESTRHRSATERPAPNPTHRVEPGQRLESIARRYGVKVEALRAYNGIGPKGLLTVGQLLRIPDKGATADSVASDAGDKAFFRAPARSGFVELYSYNERFRGRVFDRKGRAVPAAYSGVSRVLSTTGERPKLDPRLLRLLVDVSDTFGGRPIRIVSGFRTTSYYQDSRHKHSQAVDFSIPGVPNQVIRDHLRTLSKVGVGYYPNSSFVHVDVREYSAYWVDYAGPGEAPRRRQHEPNSRDTEEVHEEEPADVPDVDARPDSIPGALPAHSEVEASAPSTKAAEARGEVARGSSRAP